MENIDKNEEEVLTSSQEPAAEVKTNEDNEIIIWDALEDSSPASDI